MNHPCTELGAMQRDGQALESAPIAYFKFGMTHRIPSYKAILLTLSGLVLAFLLFSWQVMPRILQTQAEKYIARKSAHHLTMNRPEFNPFKLSLRLSGLRLTEPDGKPLLSLNELVIDLSAASLYRGALVFDDIRLDGLEATAILLSNGRLNWSALITALQSPEKTPDSPLPRFIIHRFTLSGTKLDFTDKRMTPAFSTRIEPVDLELTELSSLPGNKGQYKFAARTSFGGSLEWQGDARLVPLTANGSFKVENVNLASLAAYFKDSLQLTPTKGIARLSANYRVSYEQGRLKAHLEQVAGKLTGLALEQAGVTADAIEVTGGSFDLTKNSFSLGRLSVTGSKLLSTQQVLGSLVVEDMHGNLSERQVTLGRVVLNDGHIKITRDAHGHIDLLEAFNTPVTTKHKTAGMSVPWRYRLEKLELAGFDAAFRDETVAPAAQLAIQDISLDLTGISQDWNAAVPLKASFNVPDGGRFVADGNVIPAKRAADFQIKLTGLSLKPAQPYLSTAARLKLVNGQVSTEGRASYNDQGASFKGSFAVRDLRLVEANTGNLFLAWKSLDSRSFAVSQSKLNVGELTVDGIDTKLIINKDKTLSIKQILKARHATSIPEHAVKASPFVVNIDRFRFVRGEMDFADYSLALPFGTRIHALKGVITGLSNRPDALGQLELDGLVDEYGSAHASGQIDLRNPTNMTDIKVVFKNIEMSRLTPYSATFAGRRITSGKLSLDLEYKIKHRQLQGENQVIMDQLTLGERVASPEAKDLPLDLAIAILQDSNGKIELGLPVSGSLDDPKFSYGSIIWKAITHVLSKIVTAPFRALGALFGGDKSAENIVFESGNAQLAPPEREKLLHLAQMLAKRPKLFISIQGVYADTDRVAIEDLQLRRTIAQRTNQHLEAGENPGPLATRDTKVQRALEKLFAERLGGAELAALKQGFRQANPGQLKESTAGKMISGLTGLFHEKRSLTEQEINQLKGADFYTVLFERLRSKIVVDDQQLLSLATARGEATATALNAAGVPADRLTVLSPEKVDAQGTDVPVKLALSSKATD